MSRGNPKRRRLAKEVAEQPSGFPESQPSVYTEDKDYAVFLWIVLKDTANVKEVAKVAAKLQEMVKEINSSKDQLLAGVGFGSKFYEKAGGSANKVFTYKARKGQFGEMPSSDGDVFVHAKSDTFSEVLALARTFIDKLPKGSVKDFEDVYGIRSKDSRDLSGFVDGTNNPKGETKRREVAVERETGGSYVLTQKWNHDFKVIKETDVKILEFWVGRTLKENKELKPLPKPSHLARVRGGSDKDKHFHIVRQGLPFGTVKEAGLFFIAYASTPEAEDFMLDHMVGASNDKVNDEIMMMSKNVKGARWYFPGAEELKEME